MRCWTPATNSRKAWVSDWRSLDPAALEREYNARATVSDIDAELRAYREASTPMYDALECQRNLAYGPSPDETLDLFPVPGHPEAPLLLFIHGGYWRALSKADSVFMARQMVAQGVAVAAIDYSLAPAARLGTMVAQCRRAVAWLHAQRLARHPKPGHIIVAGSSAGAHLAAMVLAPGWQGGLQVPTDVVHAGVLVSGLYDLAPLRQTLPQTWLQLDAQDVQALSPQQHLPDPYRPVHVVVAEHDTAEFKRQSHDYAQACALRGNPVEFVQVAGRNHFDIILDWMRADTVLTRCVLALAQPGD